MNLNFAYFLAQTTQSSQPMTPVPWYANTSMFPLLIIVVVFVFMIMNKNRTKKKEEKKRNDMLTAMKRGDRVMTIGGMLGTVVDVRESDVVLKVDESSNTKIKFTREAIKRVLTEEDQAAK